MPICAIIWHFKGQKKCTYVSEALNHKFLNLTKNKKNFVSRNALVPFLNLLLLRSCKRTYHLRKRSHHPVLKIKDYSWISDKIRS